MVNYKHTGLARKQKGKKTTRNGGFFALPVWGVYIWRGLYMEGLIFGILRYFGYFVFGKQCAL